MTNKQILSIVVQVLLVVGALTVMLEVPNEHEYKDVLTLTSFGVIFAVWSKDVLNL